MLAQTHDAGHLRPVISQASICHYTSTAMPNLLILTEVQESMRARYKAMLLEQFPQLTINVVGHHTLVGRCRALGSTSAWARRAPRGRPWAGKSTAGCRCRQCTALPGYGGRPR